MTGALFEAAKTKQGFLEGTIKLRKIDRKNEEKILIEILTEIPQMTKSLFEATKAGLG